MPIRLLDVPKLSDVKSFSNKQGGKRHLYWNFSPKLTTETRLDGSSRTYLNNEAGPYLVLLNSHLSFQYIKTKASDYIRYLKE